MLAGIIAQAAGLLLMAVAVTGAGFGVVLAGSTVWAAGKVVADVAMTITATSPLASDQQGLAAGLVSTSQQLGAACGFAIAAAIVAAAGTSGVQRALLANVAFIVVAIALVTAGLSGRERRLMTPGRR